MKKTQNPVRRTKKKLNLPKMKNNSKAISMCTAIVLGPIVTVLAISIVYIAWWGLSKLFYLLHSWMTAAAVPWVNEAWPYVLGIWAFVLITSVGFTVFSEKKENEKKIKKSFFSNPDPVIEEEVFPSFEPEDLSNS